MKQDVLETLEFDKIREKLAELAPRSFPKLWHGRSCRP